MRHARAVCSFVIGYLLISRVPPLLHTPLMSMTNAVSAVTVLGALLLIWNPSQIANVAAVAGAVGGVWVGVAAGAVSLLANLVSRRILRVPEPLIFGLWLVALALMLLTLHGQLHRRRWAQPGINTVSLRPGAVAGN
mgnify:CR=1 FL=1